jgi:uncharacterized membrane protein
MFAAREIYGFFTPISALLIMFLSLLFISVLGIKYRVKILYFIGFLLASIIPFLLNIDTPNYMNFFMYISIISFGAVLIDLKTNKLEMTATAVVVFALYSLPHLLNIISKSPRELVFFAHALGLAFIGMGLIQLSKLKDENINTIILFATSLLTLSWILHAGGEFKIIVTAIWALIFVFSGLWAFQVTQKRNTLFMYLGIAVAFLAALTSMQFDGDSLTVAYTLEVGVLAFVFYHAFGEIDVVKKTSLLLVIPVLLSVRNFTSSHWDNGIIHNDFFILLLIGIVTFIFGIFFVNYDKRNQSKNRDHATLFIIIASIYAYALVWLSLHAVVSTDVATMMSLIIYTIIGLITYFYGTFSERSGYEKYGKVLLIIVLLRLFFVDVWNMELTERIITFFIVGILLTATAFLRKKKPEEENARLS